MHEIVDDLGLASGRRQDECAALPIGNRHAEEHGEDEEQADPSPALGQLRERAVGALGSRLQEVVLFDEYRGPGLETGTKSLAMGLILQEVSRTLTDVEADQAVADALAALARDCNARIRS